jgi:hypothetical protein
MNKEQVKEVLNSAKVKLITEIPNIDFHEKMFHEPGGYWLEAIIPGGIKDKKRLDSKIRQTIKGIGNKKLSFYTHISSIEEDMGVAVYFETKYMDWR